MNIITQAATYVTQLLSQSLPPDIHYHTLLHTQEVVKAARVIGPAEGISTVDQEILILSAWFHDTGFVKIYHRHEEASVSLVYAFLAEQHYDPHNIERIAQCIIATRMPQTPHNLLEMVLCDADLYHLSQLCYWERNERLRRELEQCFGLYYSENDWLSKNLAFLNKHRYFSSYGKTVLEAGKQQHIYENRIRLAQLSPSTNDTGKR